MCRLDSVLFKQQKELSAWDDFNEREDDEEEEEKETEIRVDGTKIVPSVGV